MNYKNTYYCLRHGRSTANEQHIIVSRPENGVPGYGLSPTGRADTLTKLDAKHFAGRGFTPENTVCYSSDFSRAFQTAEIFCEQLGLAAPIVDIRLRERSFGKFELESADNYERVWERDLEDAHHNFNEAESTAAVRARLEDFLSEVENTHAGKHIVCVSHGDPSQIFQTIFADLPANGHRSLPHLENAELRPLGGPEFPAGE
ncbi:MAG: histidine phosphatase family protein [bacterium]|nr:histidine phosphatase family protein [bacterium]